MSREMRTEYYPANDWIPTNGKRPDLPDSALVDVMLLDGYAEGGLPVSRWTWAQDGTSNDITHYRIHQPADQRPSADDSLTPVPDELFSAEFAAWWDEQGQFCRAGGGTYERSFAFEAWRHLYPQLMNLQMAAAEQQPAPDVAGLVELAMIIQDDAPSYHDCTDDGLPECLWCIAESALAAYRKGGDE